MRHRTTWHFAEELKPCGTPGLKLLSCWQAQKQESVSHILVSQPQTHPWFIILWEPLPHHLPSPARVQPYCCYARTIFFYATPWQADSFSRLWDGYRKVSKPGQRLLSYAQIEHALRCDNLVEWQGDCFEVGSGSVVYKNKQWWMRYWACKKTNYLI